MMPLQVLASNQISDEASDASGGKEAPEGCLETNPTEASGDRPPSVVIPAEKRH
jgi:hypothetical protein